MRVRNFVFFLLFVFMFPVFLAVTTNPGSGAGSGSMGSQPKKKPTVKFKSWKVGRSDRGTDTTSTEQKSFITSQENACNFTASVGYDNIQGDDVSPIDPSTVTWSVGNLSHGMTLEGELQNNWSGNSHPSQLATSTSFNVVGKLSVPNHIGTSKSHCSNSGGSATPTNGRADTPMAFSITFSARTEDGQDILPVTLALSQDEKDVMRQEYLDMAGSTTIRKGEVDGNVLRVPSRSELESANGYNDGHYSYMMGKEVLPSKHESWTAAFKKHVRIEFNNTDAPDLVKTGGYRNPHHHFYHVTNGSASPRGWHQFGLALDVRGKDIDADKDKERKKGTLADRKAIADAAKKYAGASWAKHTYSDGHVHAQWEWEGSNKEPASTSGKFSLPPAGTTTSHSSTSATVTCAKATENSCSVLVSSASEHSVTCPRTQCGESYWSCNSDDHNRHRLRSCTNERLSQGRNCYETWRRCQYPPEPISNTQHFAVSPLCVTDPNGNRRCSENRGRTPAERPTTIITPTPTMHPCSIHATSVSGDHTWGTFACGDATHVGYLCQASSDHSTLISGYSGSFYECQPHQTFACGHTDLTANAYTHRLESCPPNSNGDSCTAGSSYACSLHTHVYPAIVCGAASWTGCTASISSRTEHQTACSNCPESYWTCSTSGVAWHATPLTCQRSGCSVSLTKCQNTGGGGCFSNGTEYRYHDLP